jgi:uncharacterized protein involved in exopolysaccharide biosynthesis
MTDTRADPREQYERIVDFSKRALRSWRHLVVTLGAGAIAFGVFSLVRTPEYRSETLLLASGGLGSPDGDASSAQRDAGVRYREMLLARPRLIAVVKEFRLYPDLVERYGVVDAADELRTDIDFRAPGGDTFVIAFKGESPEQARAVTERLAQSLIDDDALRRRDQLRRQREFLRAEQIRAKGVLEKAERDVAQFLADHPELALDPMLLVPGAPATGAAIRAAATEAPSSDAPRSPRRTIALRAKPEPAAKPASPAGPPPIAPEQQRELEAAKSRSEADLAGSQAALADKLARFTPLHPDVKALQSRVARDRARFDAASAALKVLQARPSAPVVVEAPAPVVRHVTLPEPAPDPAPRKAAPKPNKHDLVQLETDWTRSTRTAAEARAKHEQVESSLLKADLSAQHESKSGGSELVVLDPAHLPARPVPPGRITILAIFLAVALIIGALIVATRAALDDRVYRGRDLRGVAKLLAEVPRSRSTL